jgi:hypothetical protein
VSFAGGLDSDFLIPFVQIALVKSGHSSGTAAATIGVNQRGRKRMRIRVVVPKFGLPSPNLQGATIATPAWLHIDQESRKKTM